MAKKTKDNRTEIQNTKKTKRDKFCDLRTELCTVILLFCALFLEIRPNIKLKYKFDQNCGRKITGDESQKWHIARPQMQ